MDKAKKSLLMDLLSEYVQSDEHCGRTDSVDDEHFFKVMDELDRYITEEK